MALHSPHILTVVQGNSSLNFHLRLRGAVLRLLNRRHFKQKKMNLSSIDFTAVGKSFQQRSPSVNYSVFFCKMICSKSINVKPHAALRNHFIFHNGMWQRSGNRWLLREISRKWSRKIKISGAVVESGKKYRWEKKQLWQHIDRNFWREKSVRCLNVKFSFYFLYILSVVGEWKWVTVGLYWIQWLVPAVSTVHLSLWKASWFSEVPSGNKYAHTSWHREVKVGFCSTAVHYWKLPLLASATRAVSVETEVVSVQRAGATWPFHQTQTGARLYPFLQMLQKQEAAGFSRTHREVQFCFVNSAAAHQTFGVTPLPRPLTPNMKPTASPPVLRDLQLKCKPQPTPPRFLFTSTHNALVPVPAWGALSGERLSRHPPRFSISQLCTAGLVPCLRSSSWSGATARCSAQVGLFFSQLTGDGLTSQLQPLIIPPYSVKFQPFTAS